MKIINKDSLKLFCLVVILAMSLPAHAKKDKHKAGKKIHDWEKADALIYQRIDDMQSEPKLAGANGANGATGPMGLPGIPGVNGTDGATGAVGPMGPAGTNGVDGATGPVGPVGPVGLPGLAGTNGTDGATGPVGPMGPAGTNGVDGTTGPVGPVGLPGLAGADGTDGATGSVGPIGPAGTNGIDGDPGIDGLDGFPGKDAPDRTAELCALYNVLFDTGMISPLTVPEYCTGSEKPGSTYTIGSTGPGGGIVFYVTEGGLHGMEAAPEDQSAGAEWGCYGIWVSGAVSTAIGGGAQNTASILTKGCTAFDNSDTTAARIADAYVSPNGHNDWFLPSRDELNQLFLNKGTVGGFPATDNNYWSSSGGGTVFGVYQVFTGGTISNTEKFKAFRVRAVREF